MCVVSMVANQGYWDLVPYVEPNPAVWPYDKDRIAEAERRIRDLEEMLKKAQIYDENTGQPECEDAEKKAKLMELSQELGIPIEFPS